MPTPPDVQLSVIRANYYLAVQDTLLEHLRDREVIGFGGQVSGDPLADPVGRHDRQVSLHIHDREDLDEAIRSGIVGFLSPGLTGPAMVGMRISCGDGTGIDTVAMAALNLTESMERDGLTATAMTDGTGGLYLFAIDVTGLRKTGLWAAGASDTVSVAGRYAVELASRAPEIATTDQYDASGRALIHALVPASAAPAPYSLVAMDATRALDATGVVVPLTLDEVAAASAGMPLDIDLADVPERIIDYGDLAAALSEATARPA